MEQVFFTHYLPPAGARLGIVQSLKECTELTLAVCQVLTKATLSLVLNWARERKSNERLIA